jgi:hypothetical protein
MTEAPDTRVVIRDCVAWSTKANGKPDGGADSKPVDVQKDTVVVVEGVSLEIAPRTLLVRGSIGGAERLVEIREQLLAKASR